jgi:polysaccharide transporter, PST family
MGSSEPTAGRAQGDTPTLDRSEVRRRALSGTLLLTGSGLALQAVGFGATIVFARVLGPEGLGVIAFGMTLMMLARYVGGGQGFAGALIRAQEEPSQADLHSLLGLQLVILGGITAVACGVALGFGHVGQVTAVMLISLPISAFRTPAVVLLERQLRYRAITLTDVADTLTYYVWGITTLAIGWGVWGIATAMIARALVGTAVVVGLAPRRIVKPQFSLSRSKKLFGFASRVQAQELIDTGRDQAINIGIAAIGGIEVLGIWSLTTRFLQLPWLVFNSLLRVSFPAMSRMIASGEDPKPIVDRTLRLSMLGNSIAVISLVSVAPAVATLVFGPEWSSATDVLAVAGIGVIVIVPVSLAYNSYLWAIGDASTPLRGTFVSGIIWAAVAFGLMPFLGVIAAGIGLAVGFTVNAWILARGASRHLGVNTIRDIATGAFAAVVASAAGFATSKILGSGLPSAAGAEVVALASYAAMLLAVDRPTAVEARGIIARLTRSIRLSPAT